MIEKLITIDEKPFQKVFIPETTGELLHLFMHQYSFEGYSLKSPDAFLGEARFCTIREIQKCEADFPLANRWRLPWQEAGRARVATPVVVTSAPESHLKKIQRVFSIF